jgi:opacity protein-like surface antigen
VESKNFGFNSNTKQYIAGADLEVRLPFGLGIEFDALYHPLSYSGTSGASSESVTAHSFEFPLLLKYRFPSKVVRPFLDAGVAFSTLSDLTTTVTNVATGSSATTKSPIGFVMGGGVDIHLLIIHIDPEIRYTHWGSAAFQDPLSLVQGSQNQAEFLLGVVF